jgi:hypothetical protein
MKGFLAGLIVAALAFGGYLYWKQRTAPPVARSSALPDGGAGAGKVKEKEKKRRRRGAHLLRAGAAGPGAAGAATGDRDRDRDGDRAEAPVVAAAELEPEPIKLGPADLKLVAKGDDLSRPDVMRVDLSDNSGTHELSQDDIDERFRAKQDDILACISRGRPDEETYVPGRVTVKLRIERAGTVRGVRVEAPAILMKGGLYGCIKGVVGGIRFPPSNSSQILSYPFSLS